MMFAFRSPERPCQTCPKRSMMTWYAMSHRPAAVGVEPVHGGEHPRHVSGAVRVACRRCGGRGEPQLGHHVGSRSAAGDVAARPAPWRPIRLRIREGWVERAPCGVVLLPVRRGPVAGRRLVRRRLAGGNLTWTSSGCRRGRARVGWPVAAVRRRRAPRRAVPERSPRRSLHPSRVSEPDLDDAVGAADQGEARPSGAVGDVDVRRPRPAHRARGDPGALRRDRRPGVLGAGAPRPTAGALPQERTRPVAGWRRRREGQRRNDDIARGAVAGEEVRGWDSVKAGGHGGPRAGRPRSRVGAERRRLRSPGTTCWRPAGGGRERAGVPKRPFVLFEERSTTGSRRDDHRHLPSLERCQAAPGRVQRDSRWPHRGRLGRRRGPAGITTTNGRRAGFGSGRRVRADLREHQTCPTHRIAFHAVDGPDPRTEFADPRVAHPGGPGRDRPSTRSPRRRVRTAPGRARMSPSSGERPAARLRIWRGRSAGRTQPFKTDVPKS